jgi:hypothetical protein
MSINSSITSVSNVKAATISRVDIVLADTEYTVTVPSCKSFSIQNSKNGIIKVASNTGESATNYFTLFPGQVINQDNISGSASIIFYVQSPIASQTLEVFSWN